MVLTISTMVLRSVVSVQVQNLTVVTHGMNVRGVETHRPAAYSHFCRDYPDTKRESRRSKRSPQRISRPGSFWQPTGWFTSPALACTASLTAR